MTKSLKVVFAGTPDFAIPPLQALLDSKHEILCVYTQPDRPAGRGRQLQASPVKQLAEKHQLPVCQPETLKSVTARDALRSLAPDVMIVVAYGLLLPTEILAIPRYGCINIHASLLPRWRGAAPIQRAILAGDAQTGITLMQMAKGLDTGDILMQAGKTIEPGQTSQQLHDGLARLGAQTLLEGLQQMQMGTLQGVQQDEAKANYADKLVKAEAWLDWTSDADGLLRQIWAFNPWPVAQTHYEQAGKVHVLRTWRAQKQSASSPGSPGEVVKADKEGVDVSTGSGVVRLIEVQRSGGKRMSAAEFVNANDLHGIRFLPPPDSQ